MPPPKTYPADCLALDRKWTETQYQIENLLQDVATDACSMLSVEISVVDNTRLYGHVQHRNGPGFKTFDLSNLRKTRKLDCALIDRVFIGDTPEARWHAHRAFLGALNMLKENNFFVNKGVGFPAKWFAENGQEVSTMDHLWYRGLMGLLTEDEITGLLSSTS